MKPVPQVLIVAALLSAIEVALASASSGAPKRMVWRGTITMDGGLVGTVRTRTRLVEGRDIDPQYVGRFHCRGVGCPLHHGSITLYPITLSPPVAIELVIFGARRPTSLNCVYDVYINQQPQPEGFLVDGRYTCDTVVPPEPPPVRRFAEGTLNLIRWVPPRVY